MIEAGPESPVPAANEPAGPGPGPLPHGAGSPLLWAPGVEALPPAPHLYAAILENLQVGIYLWHLEDPQDPRSFRLVAANRAAAVMTGAPNAELLGHTLAEAFPGLVEDGIADLAASVLRTGQSLDLPDLDYADARMRSGTFSARLFPLRDHIVGVCFLNVSRGKQAEQALGEEREHYQTTLSSIGDAVIATDTAGRVTFMNSVAESLTGWKLEHALGHDLGEVFYIINADTRQSVENPALRVLREGVVVGLANHTVLVSRSGQSCPIDDSGAPIFGSDGRLIGAVMVFRDVTERQRATQRAAWLQKVTSALSQALTPAEVASVILNLGLEALNALTGTVVLRTETGDELEVVGAIGLRREAAPSYRRFSITAPLPTAEIVRTGRPLWIESAEDMAARYPGMMAMLLPGNQAFAGLPLVVEGRTIGALGLGFDRPEVLQDAEERAFMVTLAGQCAQAMERARLYAAEERARHRSEFLAEASKILASSIDYNTTLNNVSHLAVPRLADHCYFYLMAEDGRMVQAGIAHRDPEKELLLREMGVRYSINLDNPNSPVGRAMAAGEPVLIPDVPSNLVERLTADPAVQHLFRRLSPRSYLVAPLIARGEKLGVLMLAYSDSNRRYRREDVPLAEELASRAALAIDRARLYQAEQIARQEMEVARQRAEFLAEASQHLATSLDVRATLQDIARLAVPRLADWCAIDILEDDGQIWFVALEHVDPAKVDRARDLRRRYPTEASSPSGSARVIRTGKSELYPEITDTMIEASIEDAEYLALVRQLGLRSAMLVPMTARERTFGAITFVWAESNRRYTPEDLALAEELARRAALAFDNARLYEEARQAVGLRDQFLSIASHELRTPLTSLKGYLYVLSHQLGDTKSQRVRRALHALESQSDRLDGLVNELLDISRLQTGRFDLDLQPLDLVRLTRDVVGQIQVLSDRHPISIMAPAEPLLVEADRERLEQVLVNLLENAIKYSPDGGPIDVTLRRGQDRAAITVRDQGIGIPTDQIPQLFQRFYRARNVSARHFGGLGLGLHISREIVERHGGIIWVESQEGLGSAFSLSLPLSAHAESKVWDEQ